jgi:hypothetical protein
MKYAFLFSLAAFSTAVFAADDINNSLAILKNSTAAIPIEYVNSCKGLSEKDSCQVHGKTNNLITGSCKTKAISADNFDLVCTPEQIKNPAADSDAPAAPDHTAQKQKHKH